MAHNALTALYYTCPPNYTCGGPAHGAWYTIDSILTLMGIGVPMLKREKFDTTEYQKSIRKTAVTAESVVEGYIGHKSHIISESIRSILFDFRQRSMREENAVTDRALLQVLQWYFKKSGTDPKVFASRIADEVHDELIVNDPADEIDKLIKEGEAEAEAEEEESE
jgi:hypothetical protein